MLTADQAGKTYVGYGDGVQMFDWIDGTIPAKEVPREAMFEGRAGTGKTRMIAEWIKVMCATFPDSKGLVMRETRKSLNDSFLPVWENEVWGKEHPVITSGPRAAYRDSYEHPMLGGKVVLGGFDDPGKWYSSSWNWIYFCEMQQTWVDKWESLHRGLRAQGTPFRILLGDCNPADEWHWANQRANDGVLHRIVAQFTDNPTLFDHDKYNDLVDGGMSPDEAAVASWREFGIEFLTRLRENTHGPLLESLFYGKWTSTHGRVWEPWDPHVHHIVATVEEDDGRFFVRCPAWDHPDPDTGELIESRRELHKFFGAADVGMVDAGVGQVWGLDGDSRMYMVAEIYKTGHDHRQWADMWAELMDEFPIRFILTDHDLDYQAALNHKLRAHNKGRPIARGWSKTRGVTNEKAGIDEVRVQLKERPDGTRGMYLLQDCLRFGADEGLRQARLPWQTFMEIGAYVYPEPVPGKILPHGGEIPDPRCIDHGCDTIRGAATWNRDHSKVRLAKPPHFAPESLNAKLGLNAWFTKQGIPVPGPPRSR